MISDTRYERHKDAVVCAIGEWGIPQEEFRAKFSSGGVVSFRTAVAVLRRMFSEGEVHCDVCDDQSFNLNDKEMFRVLECELEENEYEGFHDKNYLLGLIS